MAKYVITGSNGFIGKALTTRLNDLKHEVFGIPHEMLAIPEQLSEELDSINPDYIVHLASYGNYSDQTEEDQMLASNVFGTYMLLKATSGMDYKRFINVSSSSVYGKKLDPMTESMSLDTDTFYGCTKACGEYLARAFRNRYHKPIITIRPFSVTGIGEQSSHLIPTLIKRVCEKEEVDLVPKPVHDYIDVRDLVDAIIILCESNTVIPNVVNIGSGKQYTNEEVLKLVEQEVGKKATKVNTKESMRSYDTSLWLADTTLMRSFGWKPNFSLPESIKDMVEEYKFQKELKKDASKLSEDIQEKK